MACPYDTPLRLGRKARASRGTPPDLYKEKIPGGGEPPNEKKLPVAEIFEQGKKQQQDGVVRKPVPREMRLVEQYSCERKERAHKKSQRQVKNENLDVDQIEKKKQRKQNEAA